MLEGDNFGLFDPMHQTMGPKHHWKVMGIVFSVLMSRIMKGLASFPPVSSLPDTK